MHLFKVLSSVVCILASSVGIASAQQLDGSIRLPNVTPFKPTLTVDKDPKLCSQFKAAWTELFDGTTDLDEEQVDLKAAFPNAKFLDPPNDKSFVGYYSEASAPVDYDNDGDEEIFYAEAYHHRGIYTGTKYYLYETRDEFESEAPGQISNKREIPGPRFRYNSVKDSKAKLLADYRKIKAGAVFKKDGMLIAQSGNAAKSNQVSLDWLRVDETPQPICTLKLRGPITSPKLYEPLLKVYAGPGKSSMCYGTAGWTAPFPSTHLYDLYHRPQAMRLGRHTPVRTLVEDDAKREFRYIGWGLKDPNSFEIIREIKAEYPKFIAEMTLYYQILHGMDEEAAKATAKFGYRYLLDNIFYGRTQGAGFGFKVEEPFGPETPLDEIAKQAVETSIENKIGNLQALKLGLLTGVDDASLKTLSSVAETYVQTFVYSNKRREFKVWTETTPNDLLLASLARPKMMEYFIEKGGDLDAKTNFFGKTPLMYAAQNNDLKAVDMLLKAGADPNSKTQNPDASCDSKITRDKRTALMYAPENAEASLILTLLEGGASTADKDTEGNSPLWYLDRNETLSEAQKANLKRRF